MAAHARLKNEFTEDEKCHNLMSWLICFIGSIWILRGRIVSLILSSFWLESLCKLFSATWIFNSIVYFRIHGKCWHQTSRFFQMPFHSLCVQTFWRDLEPASDEAIVFAVVSAVIVKPAYIYTEHQMLSPLSQLLDGSSLNIVSSEDNYMAFLYLRACCIHNVPIRMPFNIVVQDLQRLVCTTHNFRVWPIKAISLL